VVCPPVQHAGLSDPHNRWTTIRGPRHWLEHRLEVWTSAHLREGREDLSSIKILGNRIERKNAIESPPDTLTVLIEVLGLMLAPEFNGTTERLFGPVRSKDMYTLVLSDRPATFNETDDTHRRREPGDHCPHPRI